ncbi:MAG: tail fiber protein [Sedimentisphaerales bacterium]|nr:tail fiber protein [Sedimentisphaerales bacterium]
MKTRKILMILALALLIVLLGARVGTEAVEAVLADADGVPVYGAAMSAVGGQFGEEMPIGSILIYAGTTPPDGWLMCDGQYYDLLAYPELFELIEFTYGSSADGGAFRVPDLTGRVPVGLSVIWQFNELGMKGGETEVTLGLDQMPEHNHGVTAASHSHDIAVSPHNHVVNVSPHGHGVEDPGHDHTVNDPGHGHNVHDPGHQHCIDLDDGWGGGGIDAASESNAGGAYTKGALTGISVCSATTGVVVNSHTTGVSVQNTTTPVSLEPADVSASVQEAEISVAAEYSGAGQPHNNVQPYLVVNYIIKHGNPTPGAGQ